MKKLNLKLIIDGDNISHKNYEKIISDCDKYGNIVSKEVFCNDNTAESKIFKTTTNKLNLIVNVVKKLDGKGNEADHKIIISISRCIDDKTIDGFILASSDGDFTQLALECIEQGKSFIGFVESSKANETYVNTLTDVNYLDYINETVIYNNEVLCEIVKCIVQATPYINIADIFKKLSLKVGTDTLDKMIINNKLFIERTPNVYTYNEICLYSDKTIQNQNINKKVIADCINGKLKSSQNFSADNLNVLLQSKYGKDFNEIYFDGKFSDFLKNTYSVKKNKVNLSVKKEAVKSNSKTLKTLNDKNQIKQFIDTKLKSNSKYTINQLKIDLTSRFTLDSIEARFGESFKNITKVVSANFTIKNEIISSKNSVVNTKQESPKSKLHNRIKSILSAKGTLIHGRLCELLYAELSKATVTSITSQNSIKYFKNLSFIKCEIGSDGKTYYISLI